MFRAVAVVGLAASLLVAAPVIGTATTTQSAAAAVEKPNVVVFLLDDAAVADSRYLTGVRRALGSEGLRFSRAIAPNPLCCPARAQLVTGQHSHNNGVLTNNGAYGGIVSMVEPDNTIGAWMHDAGYQTSYAGKYVNGYPLNTDLFGPDGIPTGWDHWDASIRGATNYWHFSTFTDCPTVDDTACHDAAYAERRYTTTVEKTKTLALIDELHQDDAPFFLFTSWTAPHKDDLGPYGTDKYPKAPKRYRRASDAKDFERLIASKPSFDEPDMSDKSPDLRRSRANIAQNAKPNYLGRAAALRAADEAITEIVDHLKEIGEFDNTLVVFTSDNGFLNGEHRLLYKKWEFEESLRVPLILSWPDGGIPVGITDRSATLVDLPATILAAAGATSQRSSLDGVSLLDSEPTTVRSHQPAPQLIGSGREKARPEDRAWAYQGVRWGPYTWTRHWSRGDAWTQEQFYDLGDDPFQVRSRASNPWYRKNIILTMKQYYADLKACAGAEQCVLPERKPIRARDPDKDGLWSFYERTVYGTDPRDRDTDGDGFRDGKDRDPLDPDRH